MRSQFIAAGKELQLLTPSREQRTIKMLFMK